MSQKYENLWTLIKADTVTTLKRLAECIRNKKVSTLKNRESIVTLGSVGLMAVGIFTGLVFNWYELLVMGISLPVLIYILLEMGYLNWYHPKIELWDDDAKVYRSDHHPHGNAHFMTEEEEETVLYRSRNINKWKGFALGIDATGHIVGKRVTKEKRGKGNANAFIAGLSGGGKDTGIVITNTLNLIQNGSSIIVASTKDDTYGITRHIAEANDYNIWVVNLRSKEARHSDGINFLAHVDSVNAAQEVADSILRNTSPGESVNYWWLGEKALLYAIILYFMDTDEVSFVDIVDFISHGTEYVESQMDMLPKGHPARTQYEIWKGGDPKPKAQVLQGLGYRLAMFDDPDIQKLVSHNDIDFKKFSEEKSIIYVLADDVSTNYRALTSMFFYTALYELEQIAKNNGGHLDNRVGIIINEAFSVGAIPNYPNQISVCRGYGIDIMTIIQEIPQLISMYPDDYKTILNNSGVKILLSTDDEETMDYFIKLSGTFTGFLKNKDAEGNDKGMSESKINLLTVDRIKELPEKDEAIVILGNSKSPLKVKLMHYWADIPGSTYEFFNDHDGKTYHAHPLLKDMKVCSVVDYYPKWAREPEKKKKDIVKPEIKKNKETGRIDLSQYL